MRTLLLVCCIATAFHSYAQVPEKFRKNRKSHHHPDAKFLVKLAPLAAIDVVSFPTITAGVEVHLAPQFSMYNEIGIRYRKGWYEKPDTSFVSPVGIKLKSEFRYYFQEGHTSYSKFHGNYIGVNAFYTYHKYNSIIDYNAGDYSGYDLKDGIGVTKKVWGLNFLWGWQDDIGKHFMFEVYEGIGVRFRNYKTTNQQFKYDSDTFVDPEDVNTVFRAANVERAAKGGTSATFNYTTGIRFAYKIL
ncbi:hypothetical protein A4D02_18450 [Niastella koreensis]|uniref:DUF3575 domain-containing protein n=2 Tax=Niastella koreensis TaxID=354356 RepID=G8T950_NIAKG|nr:DUF3575 domain-containing protein [Niastella koreensis]AEV97003.1 hypothetical protein Niako_0617 [Niastella koreensis GR20-10]OQP39303.1 hypothetical protein A4D02_18450 [Niastella koreensis]